MGQKVIKCSKNAENPSQYYAGVSSYKQAFCVDSQSVIKLTFTTNLITKNNKDGSYLMMQS